jgi:hypothetical protein
MAGTIDRGSTPDLLLYAVRNLVARYCGSTAEAERLIVAYARKGHFRTVRGNVGSGHKFIGPRSWGYCNPELGIYVPVDFNNSGVKYIRTLASEAELYSTRLATDELLEPFSGPPYSEMHQVRLARDEVLSMLRELGLLLPVEAPESVPEVALQAEEPTTTPVLTEGPAKAAAVATPVPESIPRAKAPTPAPTEEATIPTVVPVSTKRWVHQRMQEIPQPSASEIKLTCPVEVSLKRIQNLMSDERRNAGPKHKR